jgi:5-methylcytosine-specific restriction endonuclease McrA
MPRVSKNLQRWTELAPESKRKGKSNWYTTEQIVSSGLPWTKNGNQRHGKFFGLTSYIWEKELNKRKVIKIRTVGFDPDQEAAILLKNRPIAKRIYEHFKGQCCIACGSNKEMIVDHKNDLYNDQRVHNKETQLISDFQPLCNNCNLKKRADCNKTKKLKKRQPAPFQCIKMGGSEFIEGDETFDPEGLGLRGTYWYDVQAYYNAHK